MFMIVNIIDYFDLSTVNGCSAFGADFTNV